MSDINLSVVVAMAQNRVIGQDGGLPWRLPKDLAYFKKVTMGHPIVMGRTTFESIGRVLPGRENIVLTRQESWSFDGVTIVKELDEALEFAKGICKEKSLSEVMIIGGANLYGQVLPLASYLYLTEVHSEVPGDALFPNFDRSQWLELQREDWAADESNPFDYSFIKLKRK